MSNKSKITDAKIMAALITSPSIGAAAAALGIGERTVFRRLESPEFRAEFDRLQRETITAAAAGLNGALGAAVDTMTQIMNGTENSAQVRLSAAKGVLEAALKAAEVIDIERRLDALEQARNGG